MSDEVLDIKDLIITNRFNESELPSEVLITYADIDNDYQPGAQYARRLTATHTNKLTVSLPLALTSTEAARIADVILNTTWYSKRYLYSFSTNYTYAKLSVGDLVTIPLDIDQSGNIKLEQVKLISIELTSNGLVNCEAIPDITHLYTSNVSGGTSFIKSQSVTGMPGPTRGVLIDCCLVRDSDNSLGWYVGMSGYLDSWPGGILYKSLDNGATYVSTATITRDYKSIIGYTTNALGDAPGNCKVWDKYNRLNVQLIVPDDLLVSAATDLAVYNGSNTALVGAHGRWELIQFKYAYKELDGSYTLYDLLRGRQGTEWVTTTHTTYDTFILLSDTTIKQLASHSSELNVSGPYKFVSSGNSLEETSAESYTYTGERLRCLAPVKLFGGRDSSNNVTIRFTRRERVNAGWNSYADVGTSEGTNNFKVEIYSDSGYTTLKRTIDVLSLANTSEGTTTYTTTMMSTDGVTPGATIYVKVYQWSSVTGAGRSISSAI